MPSAARRLGVFFGTLLLLPVLLQSDALFTALRTTHTALALLLFATVLAHLAAALAHALIFRDGVFQSMASLAVREREPGGV